MRHVQRIYIQALLFCSHLSLNDRSQIMQYIRNMYNILVKSYGSTLNTAHVQDLIDQTEQMGSRCLYFSKIILHLFQIIYAGLGKCGKTYDCIHRRPDIMGHIAEKCGLCTVGMPCQYQGIPKRIFLTDLFFHNIMYITEAEHNIFFFFIRSELCCIHLPVLSFSIQDSVITQRIDSRIGRLFQQICKFCLFTKAVTIILRNIVVYIGIDGFFITFIHKCMIIDIICRTAVIILKYCPLLCRTVYQI